METNPTMPATDFATLLRAGIAAAKRGDKSRARFLLRQVTSLTDTSTVAWLWLASVAASREDAIAHLEKALALDPGHQRARQWLDRLRAGAPARPRQPWRCPLCQAEGVVEMGQCPTCKAVLTLDDVDAVLHNEKANRELLRRSIARLEALSGSDVGHQVHLHLGLAYLNLRRVYEGITRLRVASQLHPADGKLRKAIDDLARRLDQSREMVEHTERSTAAGDDPSRRTVLVVDDSPTVLKLVGMALERQGHTVLIAANPLQALARLDEVVPDLILLDITMPHMDGFQLCKLIRSNPLTASVPVVMLSGKDGLFDKVRGRLAGAVDHVAKPFDPAALVQAVEKHCRPA